MTEGDDLLKRRSGTRFLGDTPELQAEFDSAVAEIKRKAENEIDSARWLSLWMVTIMALLLIL